MATATATRKATTTRKRIKDFNPDYEDGDWGKIASKGQLFTLAIAAFRGADFPGAEFLRSRPEAKALIDDLAEQGYVEKRK